jgi:SWIM/SEC-C metal-binding protein
MSNKITDIGKMRSKVDAETRPGVFDGRKIGKLGTAMNPAVGTVQTEKRLKEVTATFQKNGWTYKVELEPDKQENIDDLNRLLNPAKPMIAEKKVGRNEPCSCGSGKKYKNCCGRA